MDPLHFSPFDSGLMGRESSWEGCWFGSNTSAAVSTQQASVVQSPWRQNPDPATSSWVSSGKSLPLSGFYFHHLEKIGS